jgi:hypothetical protein
LKYPLFEETVGGHLSLFRTPFVANALRAGRVLVRTPLLSPNGKQEAEIGQVRYPQRNNEAVYVERSIHHCHQEGVSR